jgi:hypothetical protein
LRAAGKSDMTLSFRVICGVTAYNEGLRSNYGVLVNVARPSDY